jgi:hypothetical protein
MSYAPAKCKRRSNAVCGASYMDVSFAKATHVKASMDG